MGAAPHWEALPFDAVLPLVAAVQQLPPRHAGHALAALRHLNRHWRAAVDDAVPCWHARAGASQAALLAILPRWHKNLREIKLDHCDLKPSAVLEALALCRHLQALTIIECSCSGQLFPALAALPALCRLSIQPSELPASASLAPLTACTALEALELDSLYEQDIAPDVVRVVRAATGLQSLRLRRSVHAVAAQAQQPFDIGFATQLTSLELRSSFTVDQHFLHLFAQLTALRRLDISGSRYLTDDGLRGISSLAGSLTALVLEGGHEVSEDGATALACLTGLRSLVLGYSNHMSSDALLPLISRAMQQLTLLDIRGCPRACAPDAFEHLSRLTGLQQLSAQGCRLQQRAAATLACISSLQHLELADNRGLAGPHLARLTSLRHLSHLDLSECELQDQHIVPLLASLPQLHSVVLSSNTELTAAVLEALAAGPAHTCLQQLEACELRLDCDTLVQLLPQLTALELLSVSANQSPLDATRLMAAALAAPSLHTLRVWGVMSSELLLWEQAVRTHPLEQRLLRLDPWDRLYGAGR